MPQRYPDYDRVAIVTGAESGIGRATAVALAREGFDIGLTWHQDADHAGQTVGEVEAAGRRAVALTAPFLCAQRAARRMIAAGRGGRIINITSVHEHAPRVGSAAYCAAKGGLGLVTKVLAQELAAHGITVNAVAPGEIATPMTGHEDADPFTLERPGVPVGRPGDAREIAAAIAVLARPEMAYVTGASWVIDGGMLLMGPQAGSALSDDEWRRAAD